MKRVAVICHIGLTSSKLASELQSIFAGRYIIDAVSLELVLQENNYDLIFLAPQYAHYSRELTDHSSSHVEILPANLYNLSHLKEIQFMIEKLIGE